MRCDYLSKTIFLILYNTKTTYITIGKLYNSLKMLLFKMFVLVH